METSGAAASIFGATATGTGALVAATATGWAFAPATKAAAKKPRSKTIFPKRFTTNLGRPCKFRGGNWSAPEPQNLPYREFFHKHIFMNFLMNCFSRCNPVELCR